MERLRGPEILAQLETERDRLIRFLRDLVEAESPSSVPETQRRVRSVLATALEELGFHTQPLHGRVTGGHLYGRPRHRRRGAGVQLLIGHYDTVWPVGTLAGRPFEVDDNVIRGPGVFDMKGGLAQIVFALTALRALSLEPALTPVIFVNADEEIGSRDSGRHVRRLARIARRAFVLEPSMGVDGRLKTARKGVARYTVTVHGRAAHAGLDPEGGASAILELSHVIQKLFALNDAERGVTVNVGTVDGGMRPNVIAPLSQAVIDVRVPTAGDAERVDGAIMSLAPETPGVRLRVEGGFGRPALERTPRNRALWEAARTHGAALGLDLAEARAGGGSDGNTTSLYTATLDGLGPVGDGAHAEHEFLYLDRTLERAALLGSLLLAPDIGEEEPS
ncbi:MAG TPA: M20 family metallopeptidase [Woeseiaceae bacterium]|nr:M20 family metallopeptidase [Woeseiaceae bacterium]